MTYDQIEKPMMTMNKLEENFKNIFFSYISGPKKWKQANEIWYKNNT